MKRILTSGWFIVVMGASAYLATTFACFAMARFSRPAPESVPLSEAEVVESWQFKNPEFEEMLKELKQSREELAAKEQQLKDLEARINNERQEIVTVTQAVFRMQRELDASMARIKAEEIPNLKKLAKVHAAMSPAGAANIFKEETDEEIIRILFYMKPGESGPILEAISRIGKPEAARAAKIADRLRRTVEPSSANP